MHRSTRSQRRGGTHRVYPWWPARGLLALSVLLLPCAAHAGGVPPGFLDASTVGAGFNTTDVTATLQAAIDTGQDVWVPNMGSDWIVRPITLTQDNQEVRFENGVVVSANSGEFMGLEDSLFYAPGRSNVTLQGYGATFRMQQADYQQAPYPAAEWRMGIDLRDVTDFSILGLTIEDTGGDGIYLGSLNQTDFNQNVTIQDVVIDNAYRNGVSVISAQDVLIDNTMIVNTGGTAPEAGIDIEPNAETQPIQNIVVRDSIIMGSVRQGMVWGVDNMSNGQQITGTIDNVTFYSNTSDGILMLYGVQPGWTIKDSLFINNGGDGIAVVGGPPSTPIQQVTHSAFSGNVAGPTGGAATLGTGSITGIAPVFVSTDYQNPRFMYLDPTTSAAITQGASDGSYMGARPVIRLGDMNGDGLVNQADAGVMVQALVDRSAYDSHGYPANADFNGDVDQSGSFDLGDLAAFDDLLVGPLTRLPVNDGWVQESSPGSHHNNDGISVWNDDILHDDRRWGLVEFNVAGLSIASLDLNLWSEAIGFSDDNIPLKQSAAIIDISTTGKAFDQLTWNDVVALAKTPLETLGSYDILAPDSDPNAPEYKTSLASAADLAVVQAIADGTGQLVLLLMADDTGSTAYAATWADSETTYGGQPPQLLINGGLAPANASAVPEPGALVLAMLALFGVARANTRRKKMI